MELNGKRPVQSERGEESEARAEPPEREGASFSSAVSWSFVMTGGSQLANLLIVFILASLLGPTAYGLVAIAMVYVAFIQLVMQQGLGAALIQRSDLTDRHLSVAFWMVMLSAMGLSVIALLGSDWWAGVNREPQLASVIRWLTPLLILRGLMVVPDSILRRKLAFRSLAVRTNVAVVGGGLVGIAAAAFGAGVWALVSQQLVTAALELAILWSAVSWRPTLTFSWAKGRELMGFSWRSAMASFGVFVNMRADALLIGVFLGPTAVGLYRFAARLVEMLLQSIVGSLRAVALPELSRLQSDHDALTGRVLLLERLSTIAAAVPLAALAVCAPAIIDFIGPEWGPSVGPLRILALAGLGRVVGQITGSLLLALGRPGHLAVLTWIAAAISATSLSVGTIMLRDSATTTQIVGLALIVLTLHLGIFLAINVLVAARLLSLRPSRLLACLIPGSAAGLLGFLAGMLTDSLAQSVSSPQFRTLLTGGAALAMGSAVAFTLEPRLRMFLARLRSAPTTRKIGAN